MKGGYDQHYLKFTSGKEIAGIVCINIDHNWQSDFRAYIRHLSVVDKSKFEEALQIAVEFIWENLYADTIRIDVFHFRPEGEPESNLGADLEIKTALGMAKKGFKWKTLINDPTGKRFAIMQMMKPKDLEVSDKVRVSRKMK